MEDRLKHASGPVLLQASVTHTQYPVDNTYYTHTDGVIKENLSKSSPCCTQLCLQLVRKPLFAKLINNFNCSTLFVCFQIIGSQTNDAVRTFFSQQK